VALPAADEESDPAFRNYKKEVLPVVDEKGLWMRIIAGEAFGMKSNVATNSPLFYVHCILTPLTELNLPANYSERAIYIVKGSVEINYEVYHAKQMVVFAKNESPVLKSREDTVLMMLGGEPLGERHIWWNFVSSRKERIEQAKADWKEGRINLPPLDDKEFIPLPEEKSGKAPEALS
jgi:redox-sensitive bicupin YhaK (pirin superfamily)